MIPVQKIAENIADGISISHNAEGLSSIHEAHCAAAIWQRRPLPSFQSWIDGLDPERLPRARVITPHNKIGQVILQVCEASGIPECDERQLLIDDATALAALFNNIVPSSYLQLRFDVVKNNACQKFHVDAVTARLICTYRGTGTQYGVSIDGQEPKRVFTVPTGSAMLLRGTLWPKDLKSSLLHRSPPIEGTNETRLLLVIDPITDPEGGLSQTIIH